MAVVTASAGQEHWLSYTCPHCLSILEVDGDWSGQVVGCPSCGSSVQLPRVGDPGLRDRRCTWCGLRASFMGFRANGQFVCPGCRAAVDKTPEPPRGTEPGPVAVVLPKAPPEKRSKQETQHITLPTRHPIGVTGKLGASGVLPHGPPAVSRPIPGATVDAAGVVGPRPPDPVVSPVAFSPEVKAALSRSLPDTVRMTRPAPYQSSAPAPTVVPGGTPQAPIVPPPPVRPKAQAVPPAMAKVPGVGAPAPAPPGQRQDSGRGPFASSARRPAAISIEEGVAKAGPKPGKEYAKFLHEKPETKTAVPDEKSLHLPPSGPGWRAPATKPAEVDRAVVARPPVREAPQGFPWMVPNRAEKPEARAPVVGPPITLPPAFTDRAAIAESKKRTDVIPIRVEGKGVGPEVSPPPAAQKEDERPIAGPEPDAVTSGAAVADTPAGAAGESLGEGADEAGAAEVARAGDLEVPERGETQAAGTDEPEEEPAVEVAEELATSASDEEEAEPPLEPSWLEAFAKDSVAAVKLAEPSAPNEAAAPAAPVQEAPEEVAGVDETEPAAAEPALEEAEAVVPTLADDAEAPEEAREEDASAGAAVADAREEIEVPAVAAIEPIALAVPVPRPRAVSGGAVPPPFFRPAPGFVAPPAGPPGAEGFGPSTIAGPNVVPVPVIAFRKKTDRIAPVVPVAEMPQAVAVPPEVSARALRLAEAISGSSAKEPSRGPMGAVRDWIEDRLPVLLVMGLLAAVGLTVFALWRSAEGKVISQAGFQTPADFQTFQKAMAHVKEGKLREALEAVRVPATRASADPGLRAFYFELRAALGEAPATPTEIAELLQSKEAGHATVARVLAWEAAWHHPDIDGRMRAVRALTQLGPGHRIPLAEREVRKALGDSADAALGPRPAGLDGYRWDERFVRWYHLRAVTGDNDARDRLIQWVKDGQTDRIRREAASLALLELDEPDAEKIAHDVWQEQMRIEAINFRVTTSRALGIDGGKLAPEEVRRIRDWATKELGYSIARAFGLLYEQGIVAGLELLESTSRNDGVYGFPAIAAVAELNRVLGGKALGRMAAIRDYWRAELAKLKADPKEASSDVGQTFQKVIGRIIEAVTIEMARAGDAEALKEVTAGLGAENDFDKVQAALKLGERGLDVAMPLLVDIARGAEKPVASKEERGEARRVLLAKGGGVARGYLDGLLADPETAIRFDAACRLLELQVEAQPKAVPAADLAPPKASK
ncbi:MAG: hypothetical protein IT577_08780 [Verrucomicrobiae bacterium]|nr:hypothetical protein [Verrucomicrobiae bacterium]